MLFENIPWYAYAIAATLIGTIFTILRKKTLLKNHAMNFESARTLSVALLGLLLIPFINFDISWKTILLVYGISILSTVGIFLAARALRHEAISLIVPLENVKPAFVAIIAFFFLGESIGLKGIIGLIIILISAYLLESDHHFSDFFAPIKNLMRDKFSLLFLLAIFIFSVNTVLNKYILNEHLDMYTYFFLTWIFIAFNFNLVHSIKYGFKDTIKCFKQAKGMPFVIAGLSMVMNLLALKALSMALASLVAPVLLLGTLFIVLFGGKYFHEKYLMFRVGATIVMLVGAYLIII